MSSVASDPALIGIDWGTSSFRAFLIGTEGEVLDSLFAPEGIMLVPEGDFNAAFERLLNAWAVSKKLPVIASGMITSRNGWVETPYIQVPAGTQDLADALVPLQTESGRTLRFVTGMTTEHNGAPDVMRGEETQIAGAIAAGAGDGVFMMPGTHSKSVTVCDGRIEDFATFMTGEVFGVLRSHTILGKLMADGPFNEQGFREGVAAGLKAGPNLLRTLFHVRTMPLFRKITEDMIADYLSGMLIGAEIQASNSSMSIGGPVTIVGRDDLADRYEIALQILGLESRRAPDDVVARGHFAIAQSAGLFS
jgi:2-dehydro-3-deoxygalactonokinase